MDDLGDILEKKELDLDSVWSRQFESARDISEGLVKPVATEGQLEKTESLYVRLAVVAVELRLSSLMLG
jgi:hypothetical protein